MTFLLQWHHLCWSRFWFWSIVASSKKSVLYACYVLLHIYCTFNQYHVSLYYIITKKTDAPFWINCCASVFSLCRRSRFSDVTNRKSCLQPIGGSSAKLPGYACKWILFRTSLQKRGWSDTKGQNSHRHSRFWLMCVCTCLILCVFICVHVWGETY